jgi:hypothetical protein
VLLLASCLALSFWLPWVVVWGCYTSPPLGMGELAWSTWNTRFRKEKRARFLKKKFNSIILLCFDFYLFIDVFGFV